MKKSIFYFLALLILASCTAGAPPAPAASQQASATSAPLPTETPAPSATLPPTSTPTSTLTPNPTSTQTPVFTRLRGKVIINQAVCHYGPGAPYLYKYGVYKDSNLELLSRDPQGIYIEVQAIGGDNPCWVKAEYFEIKGDLSSLKPVMPEEVILPMSPYYAPPAAVQAVRKGDEVTIQWTPLVLRAGDSSEQTPYIVEAWVCQDGEYKFLPLGAVDPIMKVIDQPGCEQPSRARLLAAEKHGYTRPVEIDWPE